jgi:CysZ protein
MPIAQAARFAKGFAYLLRGFREVTRDFGVLRLAALPFTINALIFTGVLYFLVGQVPDMVTQTWFPATDDMAWYWDVAYGFLWLLVVIVAFGVLFFGFGAVGIVVAAPFSDLLSAAVERRVSGKVVEAPFNLWRLAVYTIVNESRKMGVILVIQGALFAVNFIPGIGQIIFFTVTPLFLGTVMAFEFTGYPLDRRGYTFAQKRAYIKENFWLCFGFGLGVAATLPIPLLNFLLLPVAVGGGTALAVENPPRFAPEAVSPAPDIQ